MSLSSLLPVAATLLSLALSIWLFISNSTTLGLQSELQKKQSALQAQQVKVQTQQQTAQAQQEQIQAGSNLAQQVGPQVLQDLARRVVSNQNEKLRGLLEKHGVNVQEKPKGEAEAAPGKPAPAAPATPAPRAGSRLSVPAPANP